MTNKLGLVAVLSLFARDARLDHYVDTIVLYASAQRRWEPVIQCKDCLYIDVAAMPPLLPKATRVVLDGHSIPPFMILGLAPEELADIIRRISPTVLVAYTCNFGELSTLKTVFDVAPSVGSIFATPFALPWRPRSMSTASCDPVKDSTCNELPELFYYDRSFLEQGSAIVQNSLHAHQICTDTVVVARGMTHPPYLCYSEHDPPFLAVTSFETIRRSCRRGHEAVIIRTCSNNR